MFTCAFDVEVQLDGRNLKIEHTRASAGEANHVERFFLAAMAAARVTVVSRPTAKSLAITTP